MVFRLSHHAARRRALGVVFLSECFALMGFALAGFAAGVVDGVYTTKQAERGRALYDDTCADCHGAKLQGGTSTPLAGTEFIASWARPNLTLDDFYYIVRKTMPKEMPGSLARDAYADIVAYILQQNGFPPGMKELTPDPELMKTVRFGTPDPAAPGSRHLAPR